MKKSLYVLFLVFITVQNGFCLIGEILDTVKWVAGQFNEITEEVFRKSMVAKTIESVSLLQKNYEDSMRFYNEIKRIQENPYGLLSDVDVREFLLKYEKTKKLLDTYDETNKIYSQVRNDIDNIVKEYETLKNKIYSDIQKTKSIIQNNINYLQKNWSFMAEATKNIKAQTSSVVENLQNLESLKTLKTEEQKAEIERLKTKIILSQLQAQQETNMLILKLIEMQNYQQEQLLATQKEIVDRQNIFYQSIKIKKYQE